MQSTFNTEDTLRDKSSRTLKKYIFRARLEEPFKQNIDNGIARYIFTKRLIQNFLEEDGACVCITKRKALLYASLGWLATLRNLDSAYA